jgi:hypothetical protein
MSPPEDALMLCCGEKSQVRALYHALPGLPAKEGACGHHDVRSQAQWHDQLVCRAKRVGRPSHRTVPAASPTSSDCRFCAKSESSGGGFQNAHAFGHDAGAANGRHATRNRTDHKNRRKLSAAALSLMEQIRTSARKS